MCGHLKSIIIQPHFCKWEVLSAFPVRVYDTPLLIARKWFEQ